MCISDGDVKLCFHNFNYQDANLVLFVLTKYHHLYNYLLLSIDSCFFFFKLCAILCNHICETTQIDEQVIFFLIHVETSR